MNRDLVVAIAAKRHELDRKPKKAASAMLPAPASPMDCCMRCFVTKTWMHRLRMSPRANAQNAIQKNPADVRAASPHFETNESTMARSFAF